MYILAMEIEASPLLQEFGLDCANHTRMWINVIGLSHISQTKEFHHLQQQSMGEFSSPPSISSIITSCSLKELPIN